MSQRKIDGYVYNQEITKAMNANAIARDAMKRIINEDPSLAARNLLYSRIGYALADNLAALYNLSNIIAAAFPQNEGAPTRGDDRSASVARGAQPPK